MIGDGLRIWKYELARLEPKLRIRTVEITGCWLNWDLM